MITLISTFCLLLRCHNIIISLYVFHRFQQKKCVVHASLRLPSDISLNYLDLHCKKETLLYCVNAKGTADYNLPEN